ncbi:MAG: S8 family peptidase [Lachnospiraceae bacterium]|nr:S8 family peptidase [Lachnospiraceae bacterium]
MDLCNYRILSEDYRDIPLGFDISSGSLFPGDPVSSDKCVIKILDNLFILYVAASSVPPLNSAEYRYQYIPKCYGLQSDLSVLNSAGILQVNREPLNLTGRGVLLGFLDTGIRYRLPAFLNEDGTTRIAAVWDQTAIQSDADPDNKIEMPMDGMAADDAKMPMNGMAADDVKMPMNGMAVDDTKMPDSEQKKKFRAPEGFYYGVEYTREDINKNLRENGPLLFTDEDGHGTKMISAACGYDRTNGFVGAAKDADIAVVKLKQCKQYMREFYSIGDDVLCYQETDVMLALSYLDQLASKLGKPLVICIALGTTMGSHDGSSLLDGYLDILARKRNRCVVIGGGNEGNTSGHYEGNLFPSYSGIKNYDEMELLIGDGEPGFYMEIWGQIPGVYTISLTSPGGETIPEIPYRLGQSLEFSFIYSASRVVIDYVPVDLGNGQELITLRFIRPVPGIWKIRVFAGNGEGLVHSWLPLRQFLQSETYFLRPSPYETITEPAYSRTTLAVSSYNSADQSFYLNSGRGFSIDGSIVPSIAAPGVLVPTVMGAETGSSMAAAITAGAAADFMQWAVVEGRDITINTQSIKNYFIRGATRKKELYYPSREWGYGTLNLEGVFDVLAGL